MESLELLTHQKTSDLPAGAECPVTGIYVVTHRNPTHAGPHEVLIATPAVLPRCKICASVRFSLMRLPVEAIHENEFFALDERWPRAIASKSSQAAAELVETLGPLKAQ
jgi:hypothetical protein